MMTLMCLWSANLSQLHTVTWMCVVHQSKGPSEWFLKQGCSCIHVMLVIRILIQVSVLCCGVLEETLKIVTTCQCVVLFSNKIPINMFYYLDPRCMPLFRKSGNISNYSSETVKVDQQLCCFCPFHYRCLKYVMMSTKRKSHIKKKVL